MSPVQASLLLFTLSGQLAEPGAVVLSLLEGDQVEDYYGWVAANLPDVDGDGVLVDRDVDSDGDGTPDADEDLSQDSDHDG
ncbi:MAG: hypothetical protein KC933_39125, partial [Myxococcales bacterium]|nr:hypothetical protein [Myxococcales bacterium]